MPRLVPPLWTPLPQRGARARTPAAVVALWLALGGAAQSQTAATPPAPATVAADGTGSAPAQASAPAPDTTLDTNLNLAPQTPAALIGAALRRGDKAAALKIADEHLAVQPRDAQLRFLRAVILGDLNRLDEAAQVLESLTADFPELAEPYNNLAVIRANRGQLISAEHLLQRAVAAQPNYVTARENLGDLYISLASAAYEQASRLSPENPALRKKLAMARELGGKLRSAR